MAASSVSARGVLVLTAACAWITLGACKGEPAESRLHPGERTTRTSQKLVAEAEHYVGVGSLGAKQLALTFDDGPGLRTSELSTYLKDQGIRAVFFVNGACIQATGLPNNSCGTPTANATAILAQLASDGHLVANHTTTHRDITGVPTGQRVQEVSETDALIKTYGSTPYNRSLFRAPFGSWSSAVNTTLQASAMSHYVGPIYWDIGGFSDQYPNAAADWACFQGDLENEGGGLVHGTGFATTKECGDAYLTEIAAVGRGIILMHDPYSWASGSTVDMVKYLVPLLKADGYTFVRADDVPIIAADLPACNGAGCTTCSGAAAGQCTTCAAGRYLTGGACPACTVCTASEYQISACTASANTVCAACTVCAAGSYTSTACTAAANAACTPCAAGTASSTPGATSCTPCAAGTYAGPGATACTSCGGCDDSDPCTTDACSETTGCTHTPIEGCTNDAGASSSSSSSGSSGSSSGSSGTSSSSSSSSGSSGGTSSSSGDPGDASTSAPSGGGGGGCEAARSSSAPSGTWLIALGAIGLAVGRRRSGRARS